MTAEQYLLSAGNAERDGHNPVRIIQAKGESPNMELTNAELIALGMTREELPIDPKAKPGKPASAAVSTPEPYAPIVPVSASAIDKLIMQLPAYRRFALQMTQGPGAALVGPAGSFKSSIIATWCRAQERTPYQLTCFPNMQIDDLVGRYVDAAGKWQDGMLPRSYKATDKPVLVMEEMNLAHPGMPTRLNTISDGLSRPLEIAETGETIAHNPDWRVCAAYNEGTKYGGTRDTNTAFINRLGPIWCPYPEESIERNLLGLFLSENPADPDIAVAMKVAKMTRAQIPTMDLSVRPLIRFIRQRRAGFTWREAAEGILDLCGVPELTMAERKILTDQIFPMCLPK